MIQIIHYRDKCIGCNACVEAAPNQWRISRKDGKSILIGGNFKKGIQIAHVGKKELPENIKASIHCPVNVIRVQSL